MWALRSWRSGELASILTNDSSRTCAPDLEAFLFGFQCVQPRERRRGIGLAWCTAWVGAEGVEPSAAAEQQRGYSPPRFPYRQRARLKERATNCYGVASRSRASLAGCQGVEPCSARFGGVPGRRSATRMCRRRAAGCCCSPAPSGSCSATGCRLRRASNARRAGSLLGIRPFGAL